VDEQCCTVKIQGEYLKPFIIQSLKGLNLNVYLHRANSEKAPSSGGLKEALIKNVHVHKLLEEALIKNVHVHKLLDLLTILIHHYISIDPWLTVNLSITC